MVNPSSARPYDPVPESAPSAVLTTPPGPGGGRRAARRAAVRPRRRGLRFGGAVLVLAAAAAYPVHRFVLDADPARVDPQVGTCLAGFGGFMGEAPRPATVLCGSPDARWKITAVFGPDHGAVPCRSLGADKGYEAGLEWRDPAGGFVCLTVTPNTTYEDYGDVGTMPYGFNEADFDILKHRLLAATGQTAPTAAAG